MKRTFIRALAMALAVIMSLTGIAFTISAASFSDTGSHWSNQYVDYMAKKAIIAGYGDGTFKPDNKVSRAEFIKMLVETFGLTAVGPFVYNDVKETDWFYPYIGKAAAQGFLIPGSNYLDPNGQLTRAEAAALLVRYLDLPADMTVATNYYPDYNTISSIYRTYVLQATAAGLFKGYEDGAFRPNNTLTRAEAMTILYRAAGSIYNESARGIDEGANTENAVVTKAGVNVSDANLRGNVIISEGAESGTVMFSNSNINGTLFVRGKVKVNLTNTKVNKLVVDSDAGYSVNVILAGNTNVDLAELRSRAGVTINTGTTVGALNVAPNARSSNVTGSGTLRSATIRATGFTSTQIPSSYDISEGITATFAGSSFKGSSTGTNGFITSPYVKQQDGSEYIYFTPAGSGSIRYYYSNSAVVPSSTSFSSGFNAAAEFIKGTAAATAGTGNSAKTNTLDKIEGYGFVVVMLTAGGIDYAPVVINRSASAAAAAAAGFSEIPVVSQVSGSDRLTYKAVANGTVKYYYTNDANAPAAANYDTYFAGAAANGTLTASAGTNQSAAMASETTGASYEYVVLMLTAADGTKYTPMAVSRTGDATASGFSSKPIVVSSGEYEFLNFSTNNSGNFQYYYANTSGVPSNAAFAEQWNGAPYKGRINCAASSNMQSAQLQKLTDIASYGFIVLMFNDNSGKSFTPYVVARAGQSAAASGFSGNPSVSSDGTNDILSVATTTNGQVAYYYTTNATAPTTTAFRTNFSSSQVSGTVDLQTVTSNSKTTAFSQDVLSYGYVALMFTDNKGNAYTPIVVARGTGSNVAGTGFNSLPTLSQYNNNDYLTYSTSITGQVKYYYANSAILPTITTFDSFYTQASYFGAFAVSAGSAAANAILKPVANVSTFSHIVMMATDNQGNKSTPLVISRSAGTGAATATGFNTVPTVGQSGSFDVLNYSASITGTCYYYYTNNPVVPTTYDTFSTGLNAAPFKGQFNTIAGNSILNDKTNTLQAASSVAGYNYVVLMIVSGSTGSNSTPILVNRVGAAAAGTGFQISPVISQVNSRDVLTYSASASGNLMYYYTNSLTAPSSNTFYSTWSSSSLSSAYKGAITVNTMSNSQANLEPVATVSGYSYVAFMLQGSNGSYYTPFVLSRNVSSGGGSGSTDNTGFYGDPYLGISGSWERLSYRANYTGTINFYYTNDPTMPTIETFNFYSNNSPARGVVNVTTTSATSTNLLVTTEVASFKYLFFMLTDTYGNRYKPICINRQTGTAVAEGFVSAPQHGYNKASKCNTLEFTPTNSGLVYYYYTKEATKPTASSFMGKYNNANHRGVFSVSAMTAYNYDTHLKTDLAQYHNVVVQYVDVTNKGYDPYMVSFDTANFKDNDDGFTVVPEHVITAANYDQIKFTAKTTGELYYYYTNSNTTLSQVQFYAEYEVASASIKGVIDVLAIDPISLTFTLGTANNTYNYIAVMLVDTLTNEVYLPYIITRQKVITGNGFTATPVVTQNQNEYDILRFTPSNVGENPRVQYYYVKSDVTSAPATTSEFITKKNDAGAMGGTLSAIAGIPNIREMLLTAGYELYTGVICMLESDTARYQPVYVSRYAANSNSGYTTAPYMNLYEFNGGADKLNIVTNVTGRMYWYFNNTRTSSMNATTFLKNWAENAKGEIAVTGDPTAPKTINLINGTAEYQYVNVMLLDTTYTYKVVQYPRYIKASTSANPLYTSTVVSNGGFTTAPKIEKGSGTKLVYTPVAANLKIYGYYTNSSGTPQNPEAFFANYNNPTAATELYTTAGTSAESQPMDTTYKYFVIMTIDPVKGVYFTPKSFQLR
ncbi:MAG: S-layer homology domain-containing protein [Clostridiales bacterium]|nr:S-layer homology domain-containing protein [Clostridiales bacterium]